MTNQIISQVSNRSLAKRKLVYGVGINDADYHTNPKINGKTKSCQFYVKWIRMIQRCYSEKYQEKQPTYKGCSVAKEWHLFSNFKQWMQSQDWEGNQLDKDILKINNKIYSHENCIFVSRHVNSLLNDHGAKRGKYPQGVTLIEKNGLFLARCNVDGKTKRIGRFKTPEEASKAYKTIKYNEIIRVANTQSENIKQGLYRHAEVLLIE